MVKKPDPESSFGQNPFKQLKGFAVSSSQQADKVRTATGAQVAMRPAAQTDKNPPDKPGTAPLASDAEPSFIEEMRRLGVSPQAEPEIAPSPEADSQPESREPAADTGAVTEEQLFIRALGRFETTFNDDYDLEQSPPTASPRRMKQLRQGTLQPEARLDLHGLTRDQVRSRVRFFLEDAAHHKKKVVLIITGWGKNSSAEPVVRLEVERYLALDAKAWVVEYGRAPRQLGGEGALVVFLKGS